VGAAGVPPAPQGPDEAKRREPQRVLGGPRRRRFYGAARRARVPELTTLLPGPEWIRTRAE